MIKTSIYLTLTVVLLCQICCVSDPINSLNSVSGIGYYKAVYVSDTIPSSLEAGSSYPVTITFQNTGMVSWEWGVEKFGMLYQGLQSSINVDPIFSPVPAGTKILTQSEISFPLTLTPPEKPGEYDLSFSMAVRKGEGRYEPFSDSFTKRVYVMPVEGVSSGSMGSIVISSEPAGATVLMGGEEKGKTPLTLPDLNPASYEITVSHPDYTSKYVKTTVQPGSVSRVTMNLTDSEKPEVVTEKLLKYTPLGWFLDNLPLILITLVILFLAFQVVMMDTKHVPENHPVRIISRPITLFKPYSDGTGIFRRRNRSLGKGRSADPGIEGAGDSLRPGNKKSGASQGNIIRKDRGISDRSSRRDESGDRSKKSKSGKDEEQIKVSDVDQDEAYSEGFWGFPHTLLDKYEPMGIEGDDPYARIFKVKKKSNGEIRALKVAHMKEEGSEILQKETNVWRSLMHPHIIHVFRSEFLEDQTYLENEYLKGVTYHGVHYTSLKDLPKPIRKQYAVSIIRDVASGLAYAHEIGVRHYHIQPGVILLTSKLRAKLSGFARGRNELGFSIPDSEVGKAPAAYIAPEQRDGNRYGNPGRRTDIYQLGVIFYELLTGYLPYTPEAYIKSGREGAFEDHIEELVLPSEIRPDLKPCDDILKKMLSKVKSGRYYLVNDLLADIDKLKWLERQGDEGEQRS